MPAGTYTDQMTGNRQTNTPPQNGQGIQNTGQYDQNPANRQTQTPQNQIPPEPPTEFQSFVTNTLGVTLPIYGADLFLQVPSTFAPINMAAAPASYVIGAGDEIRIRVWGQINFQTNLQVDRSGDIFIPQVGPVHVEGAAYSDLAGRIRTAIGRVFHNFDLTADIGQTRSLQVYVTGQARRPGLYTVSALSTLVDTLFASGGPATRGSMRHIQVRRGNSVATDFDLYDLLVKGDKTKDIKLLPGDVIFIPAVGSQVAISGSVRYPAIYELRGDETLSSLLVLAGGLSSVANGTRVSIERIQDHLYRQAMEMAYDQQGEAMQLADGDLIHFYSVAPLYRQTVTLRGNLANPGRFAWHQGMRLSELIPDKDALVTRNYWWKRAQLGFPAPEFQGQPAGGTKALNTFTLQGQGPQGRSVASATAQSSLSTRGTTELSSTTNVEVLSPEIDWNYAVIERQDKTNLKTKLLPFDLGKLVLSHDSSQDLELESGDVVTIFSEADVRMPIADQTKLVRLDGEIAHAGVYSVLPGESLRQLVERAGGLTTHAYLYGSELTRISTQTIQQARIDEYIQTLSLQVQHANLTIGASTSAATNSAAVTGAGQDLIRSLQLLRATGRIVLPFKSDSAGASEIPELALEDGDRFTVPSVPETINVIGAVYNQNSFLYVSSRHVGAYLKLAGGTNRFADPKHEFVIRANGEVIGRDNTSSLWSSGFASLRIFPGDTLVVPEKTIKPSAIRGLLDWTQIFSQLALTSAALNSVK